MNSDCMDWAILVLTTVYAAALLWLRRGVAQAEKEARDAETLEDLPTVSVIVPAHNEAQNIGSCLAALIRQDYPAELLEIVVVDDRSDDGTGDIVQRLAEEYPYVRLVRVEHTPPGFAPKKFAIHQGIQSARGEIILTTDADCRPPRTWVRSMVSYFDRATGAVVGFSPLVLGPSNPLLRALYRLDSLALASLAAGSVGIHYPLTCSGRNFAYRRQVYVELGGFGKFAAVGSGDDDLLLGRIRDETAWKIRYAFAKQSHVPARPVSSAKALWNQRTRHASKALLYAWPIRAIAAWVYAVNLGFLALVVRAVVADSAGVFAAAWLLKWLPEFLLLHRTARALQFPSPLWMVPVVSVVHAAYVLVFGFLGQVRSFEWKGRSYQPAILGGGKA